jgi:signal transduction histidine kinase
MTEHLQDKLDYYEFLIGFVSHEIRNPLAAMVMFGKMLQDGSYGPMSSQQKEVVDRIMANATRIEHMTDDFLNLSLLEGKENFLTLEALHLYRDLIDPAIESLAKKSLFTPEQRTTFQPEVEEDVAVAADRRLIGIVFDNLFFNAVKYGREGGKIVYGWREEGDRILVHVQNEGQGVRPGDISVIFEKFIRLQDPNIPPQKGTGLGLFNVRKIIERHGGSIRAESIYGRTFDVLFTLPRKLPAPASGP